MKVMADEARPVPAGSMVRFGVLGPLQVVDSSGATRAVTAGKQRIVLATLLLAGGSTVSAASLADAVWDGSPPPNTLAVMRTYVARLRGALGPAGSRIVGRAAGWAIDLSGPAELDVAEVDRLWRTARAQAAAGHWQEVSSRLASALRLWRGEPLADVPSTLLHHREAGRLDELRLQLTEARVDADLRLGRHGEVVAELRALVVEHPLREHLRMQLMLACYRCGHQAAALEVYRDARRTLTDELGVDPGPDLSDMHQRILAGDPGLAAPAPAVAPAPVVAPAPSPAAAVIGGEGADDGHPPMSGAPVAPAQLPVGVPLFTGRVAELARLTSFAEAARASSATAVLVISGMAGVGKSALAVHWAHQAAGLFPDGQLYVNLRGFDPSGEPADPAQIVRGFLGSLGLVKEQIPAELDAQFGLYRSLLAGKRMLVVIDNARAESQVRPLLPASPGCLIIVTSRKRLAGLVAVDGAQPLALDVLTDAEAGDLLAARLGQRRATAETAAVAELTRLCARLPLALAIAAARAAARPAHPLAALAAELHQADDRLDALDAGEPAASMRTVFSWSCRHLSADAARMFRLLGIHPGPDISEAAAASLAGVSPPQASKALAELTAASLLSEGSPGRYVLHDLLRLYATNLAGFADFDDERREAIGRMLDHYLHTANRLLAGGWRELKLTAPRRGVTPEAVGPDSELAWFEAEHKILLRLVGEAAANGFDARVWQLPWTMADFLDRRGYWHDWIDAQQAALAAAWRLKDRTGQARAHHSLGQACIQLCRYADGHTHLGHALGLYARLGDREGQAHVYICRCVALYRQLRCAEALTSAQQALDVLGPSGRPDLRATALNDVGYGYALTGDYQQALRWCEQARDLCAELGARYGEAYAWDSMGYAHQYMGQYALAIDCYQRARHLHFGNRYEYGRTLARLGDAYQLAGNATAARQAWQQALTTFDDLPSIDTTPVRVKLGLQK